MKEVKKLGFRLLCLSGVLAGGFLLLCAWGILNPDDWGPEEPAVMTAVPALGVADQALFQGPFLCLAAPDQPIPPGTRGVILAMKGADGHLGYVSQIPRGADLGASSGDPDRNETIRALTAREDLHTVALIACLADDLAGQDRTLALLRQSGSPWVDETGQTWLDPSKEDTLVYLTEICREVAALGFDELLLTGLSCPRAETDLGPFCRSLQQAALDWPVILSVVGSPGHDPALLASFPGRVWARQEDAGALSAFDPVVLPDLSSN